MMKKKKFATQEMEVSQAPTLQEKIEQSPLIHWMFTRGKMLLLIVLAVFAALFIVYKFSTRQSIQRENAYLNVEKEYQTLNKAIEEGDAEEKAQAFAQFEKLLKSEPTLETKYGGPLAQMYLSEGEVKEALPRALATLQRTAKEGLEEYQDFAQISLLTAQGKKSEALERAKAQRKRLVEGELDSSNLLFAYTLLRIAFLEQALGNQQAELKAWKQFKKYAGLEKQDASSDSPAKKEAFQTVISLFSEGEVSLPNYINFREKEINKG